MREQLISRGVRVGKERVRKLMARRLQGKPKHDVAAAEAFLRKTPCAVSRLDVKTIRL
jgi:hypothetical protein